MDQVHKKQLATRKDFRNKTTFTIDPITAKDFDDAISFAQLPGNKKEIGIHIADVARSYASSSKILLYKLPRGADPNPNSVKFKPPLL